MLMYHLQATRGGLPSVRLVNSAKILLSREARHHGTVFTVLNILYNWEINALWASRDCYELRDQMKANELIFCLLVTENVVWSLQQEWNGM